MKSGQTTVSSTSTSRLDLCGENIFLYTNYLLSCICVISISESFCLWSSDSGAQYLKTSVVVSEDSDNQYSVPEIAKLDALYWVFRCNFCQRTYQVIVARIRSNR